MRYLAILAALLLLPGIADARHGRGAASSGGSGPVTVYNAITNTNVYTEVSPAPTWGAAGSTSTDSIFGSKLSRVTDGNTAASKTNHSWYPNTGSAEENRWSAGDTRFLIVGDGGECVVYDFNQSTLVATLHTIGSSYSVTNATNANSLENCQWDAVSTDLVWGIDGSGNVSKYSISGQNLTTVWSTSGLSGAGSFGDLTLAYGNGRLFARLGPQDTATILAAYSPSGPTQWVLNTSAGTMNGSPIQLYVNGTPTTWSPTYSFTVHNLRSGPDGRYAMITATGNTIGTLTNVVAMWDVDGGTVSVISAHPGGHNASAYGTWVNNDYISGYTPYQMLTRSLTSQAGMAAPSNLNSPSGSYETGVDTYVSWTNAASGYTVPIGWTTIEDGSLGDAPGITVPYQRELGAIATDGSGTVYRFAHHYSWFYQFYDGVHATMSRGGLFMLFGSNWATSLGLDAADPQASFTGVINSSGVLTVSGVTGTIAIGMVINPTGNVLQGTYIQSGSGTTWQTNATASVASQAMTAGQVRDDVFVVGMTP